MRRSRFAVLGAVLAIVAMFGLAALSGWHNATIHDHDIAHATATAHGHTDPATKQADTDGMIHLLAHATSHWVALADPVAATMVPIVVDQAWPGRAAAFRVGIGPSGLLRPPRG